MDKAILETKLKLHLTWLIDNATGERANLSGANLSGANLSGANLSGANLSGADPSRANLSGANLYGANLYGANLSGANLYGANLYGANLSGANLSGANLKETLLEGKAILSFQFEKHTAYFMGTDEIVIGCHRHTVNQWLETFESVGKSEGYSDKQIAMYGAFIKQCALVLKG